MRRWGATRVEVDDLVLPPAPIVDGAPGFTLRRADGMLVLDADDADLGRIAVDLVGGRSGWRGERVAHERVVRACGVLRHEGAEPLRIVDGTGGLGEDAWFLAAAGARVLVLEHHPVLRALLEDGVRRAAAVAPEIAARLRVEEAGDTRLRIGELDADVLYLDPMYPARRKRALGERRLRLLGALLASDGFVADAAGALVEAGLAAGIPRVVLKRPVRAEVVTARPPNHRLPGRSTRFDVWVSAAPG